MPDSETEDEILARIETALQKIAAVGKPAPAAAEGGIDRAALTRALDTMIGRLRGGLEPPGQETPPAQSTE